MLAALMAMKGRRVLEAAPIADQTTVFWETIKSYFADPIKEHIIRKNENDRLLVFPNGGRIRCKTAHDADTLRGDYADLLILDEYSFMEPDAWEVVGQPMLIDNDGDAVFIFTPNRRNHAWHLYNNAMSETKERWAAWHFTTFDNPHLSQVALKELVTDMGEDAYKQEIMAEFLEGEGAVFRNIESCMNAPESGPDEHKTHYLVAGLDWGQKDFTATSIGCVNCSCEVAIDRFNRMDYASQRERLMSLYKMWDVKHILSELNSIGKPNFEELAKLGYPMSGFQTSATSKPPLIENLALALERESWQFIRNRDWIFELEAYERKTNPITGSSQYSAPEGEHDDTVMARALMLRAAGTRARVVDNPFDM